VLLYIVVKQYSQAQLKGLGGSKMQGLIETFIGVVDVSVKILQGLMLLAAVGIIAAVGYGAYCLLN
jgi:hypothetical protein